jgi:hypothetical protein
MSGLFGYGSAKSSNDTSSPTITSLNLGVGLGINIKKFSLGVSYDYRSLSQISDVDVNVGNRRGVFTSPISILLRLNFEAVQFGVLIINSGQYEMLNNTATGQKLTYSKPSGFRFTLNMKKIKKVSPTIFYESVTFSQKELDGVATASSDNLSYANYGLGVRYEF